MHAGVFDVGGSDVCLADAGRRRHGQADWERQCWRQQRRKVKLIPRAAVVLVMSGRIMVDDCQKFTSCSSPSGCGRALVAGQT
jgi:hypothetical protein